MTTSGDLAGSCIASMNDLLALHVACVARSPAVMTRLADLLACYSAKVVLINGESERRADPSMALFDLVCIDRPAVRDVEKELRRWRYRWPSTQVVLLNVVHDADVRRYLDAGADDVTRSDGRDFESRINAAARRARTLNAGLRVAIGDIVCDREAHRVWCAGEEIHLTPHEFRVLDCLFLTSPLPACIEALREFAWHGAASRSCVEVYVGYLRRKLRRSRLVALRTERGLGYTLVVTGVDNTKRPARRQPA